MSLFFKLASTVRMKYLDVTQVSLNRRNSLMNKLCIFVYTGKMTDNLAMKEVNEYAYVLPLYIFSPE